MVAWIRGEITVMVCEASDSVCISEVELIRFVEVPNIKCKKECGDSDGSSIWPGQQAEWNCHKLEWSGVGLRERSGVHFEIISLR